MTQAKHNLEDALLHGGVSSHHLVKQLINAYRAEVLDEAASYLNGHIDDEIFHSGMVEAVSLLEEWDR